MQYNTKKTKFVEIDTIKKDFSFEEQAGYTNTQLNNDIQVRNAPKILVFDINPNIRPNNIGDLRINKTLWTAYISTNVMVTADWKLIT